MRKYVGWLLGAALVAAARADVEAAVIVADFNDLVAGSINTKAGGTGFTGNWTGSSGGTVVANDLSSALYKVAQTGTAQHYRSINATGLRQNYRTPAASPTGTIWFSFLAMAESTGDRAGVSINPPTATPFSDPGTAYAYLVGDTLNYQFGAGTAGTLTAAAPVGSTALVVGKITLGTGGAADPVQLWVNPDLIANPDINAYTPVYSNASVDWLNSISTLGAVAARFDGATTGGGDVDNIRFSDGGGNPSQAYTDVTGVSVPEPTSLMGLVLLTGLGFRRHRRSTRRLTTP